MIPAITKEDFQTFHIEGLEPRMQKLRTEISPKLKKYGEIIASHLTVELQDPFHAHVAKHARRTVHPPESTWVAWSTNNRGYKSLPHFQVGLRDTYLFAWFGMMSECKQKTTFAQHFQEQFDEIWPLIPNQFFFSPDHTQPDVYQIQNLSTEEIQHHIHRLQTVKKAEFFCGIILSPEEAIKYSGEGLIQNIEAAFRELKPLYQLARP